MRAEQATFDKSLAEALGIDAAFRSMATAIETQLTRQMMQDGLPVDRVERARAAIWSYEGRFHDMYASLFRRVLGASSRDVLAELIREPAQRYLRVMREMEPELVVELGRLRDRMGETQV